MSWTSVLLLSLAFGLGQSQSFGPGKSQYDDYGPPPDYDGGELGPARG